MFQLLSAGCVEWCRLSTLMCTEVRGVEPTAETPLLRLSAAVSVPGVRETFTHSLTTLQFFPSSGGRWYLV